MSASQLPGLEAVEIVAQLATTRVAVRGASRHGTLDDRSQILRDSRL
jgi:hypothetical protein